MTLLAGNGCMCSPQGETCGLMVKGSGIHLPGASGMTLLTIPTQLVLMDIHVAAGTRRVSAPELVSRGHTFPAMAILTTLDSMDPIQPEAGLFMVEIAVIRIGPAPFAMTIRAFKARHGIHASLGLQDRSDHQHEEDSGQRISPVKL